MIVAVGLFSVVMLICVSALLALVQANRKVHALQSVMDNLNITVDGMVRSARMGSNFHCGSGTYNVTRDCPAGDNLFAFEPYGSTSADQPWVYRYDPSTKRLYKSEGGHAEIAVTAPEITIDSMVFYVVGTRRGCDTLAPCVPVQPKVVIEIKGTAPVTNSRTSSTFHLQVTAVQRLLDL